MFGCSTEKKEATPKLKMPGFLQSEARGCDYIVLWLDCDKVMMMVMIMMIMMIIMIMMMIMLARLAVTRPRAAVTGGREKHVNLGDRVSIACELRDSGDEQQPEFVFW